MRPSSERTPVEFLNASLHHAIRIAQKRATRNADGGVTVQGHLTITPVRREPSNESGCFIFNVCWEDEESQSSHCEEQLICGEFPSLD